MRAPALATTTMPSRVIASPSNVMLPLAVASNLGPKSPWKIGGISVPNTVHSPSTTAMPSDSPRYRIVSP